MFFIAGLTDGLDGFIARTFHQKSLLGAFLDPIADKALLVTAFVALAWLGMIPYWLTGVVITRDLAIIFGASLLVIADVPFEVRPSIIGKITTLFQLITVFIVLSLPHIKLHSYIVWTLFLISALVTGASGWQYTRRWMILWETHSGGNRLIHRFSKKLLPIWYGRKKGGFFDFLAVLFTVPYLFALKVQRSISLSQRIALRSFTISVGNLTVGGTGKTPFTIQLAENLLHRGHRVTVVGRSLGKVQLTTPERIHIGNMSDFLKAHRYGDEPTLTASHLPSVWVGRSKSDTAQAAYLEEQPDVIIVDDAYQHWRLERNLDVVLFDADLCVGNGYTLPLGPLREPLSCLKRADVVVMVGTQESSSRCLNNIRKWLRKDVEILYCQRKIEEIVISGQPFSIDLLKGLRCLAFAGIAYPDGFFKDIERQGIVVVHRIPFPDHYFYLNEDIVDIMRLAGSLSVQLVVTTEKDFLKLPDWAKKLVAYSRLSIVGKDAFETLGRLIDNRLKGNREKGERNNGNETQR